MEEKGFKFYAPTPYIFFSYSEIRRWIDVKLEDIIKEAENLRVKVKEGMDYFWDNQHFIITDIYGKPALNVLFTDGDISFWNARTGDSLYSCYGDVFTEEDYQFLDDALDKMHKGKRYCRNCKSWVDVGSPYSFAGFVCENCYDPEVHKAPDSR